jgi:hypothetical protein
MPMDRKRVSIITNMETPWVFGKNGTRMDPESMKRVIEMESSMALPPVGMTKVVVQKKIMKIDTKTAT